MCTRATLAEVRKLQKAAGILNENDIDYSLDEMLDDEGMLKEKMQSPVNDEWCTKNKGYPAYAWACDGNGWRACEAVQSKPNWFCDDGRTRPQRVMHENTKINEAETSTTCKPLPDGTKTIGFITGPSPKDFICLPVNAKPVGQNGVPLKKVGGPTTPTTTPTAPTPGMQV